MLLIGWQNGFVCHFLFYLFDSLINSRRILPIASSTDFMHASQFLPLVFMTSEP